MARSPAQTLARQRALRDMLSSGEDMCTSKLAERFGVDAITIRRDLKSMEEAGLVVRRYGGAVAAQRISFEYQYDLRHQRNLEQKRRIGGAAAKLIEVGQSLFLDSGTTTLEIARALRNSGRRCSVLTSSLIIASELWASEQVELTLLGGRVRQRSPDLVGSLTEMMLDRLTVDVAFLGSDGIHPNRGSFAGDTETARVAERMAANSGRVIVVADSSKLGVSGAVRYVTIDEIDELISDDAADKAVVALFERRSLKVTLV